MPRKVRSGARMSVTTEQPVGDKIKWWVLTLIPIILPGLLALWIAYIYLPKGGQQSEHPLASHPRAADIAAHLKLDDGRTFMVVSAADPLDARPLPDGPAIALNAVSGRVHLAEGPGGLVGMTYEHQAGEHRVAVVSPDQPDQIASAVLPVYSTAIAAIGEGIFAVGGLDGRVRVVALEPVGLSILAPPDGEPALSGRVRFLNADPTTGDFQAIGDDGMRLTGTATAEAITDLTVHPDPIAGEHPAAVPFQVQAPALNDVEIRSLNERVIEQLWTNHRSEFPAGSLASALGEKASSFYSATGRTAEEIRIRGIYTKRFVEAIEEDWYLNALRQIEPDLESRLSYDQRRSLIDAFEAGFRAAYERAWFDVLRELRLVSLFSGDDGRAAIYIETGGENSPLQSLLTHVAEQLLWTGDVDDTAPAYVFANTVLNPKSQDVQILAEVLSKLENVGSIFENYMVDISRDGNVITGQPQVLSGDVRNQVQETLSETRFLVGALPPVIHPMFLDLLDGYTKHWLSGAPETIQPAQPTAFDGFVVTENGDTVTVEADGVRKEFRLIDGKFFTDGDQETRDFLQSIIDRPDSIFPDSGRVFMALSQNAERFDAVNMVSAEFLQYGMFQWSIGLDADYGHLPSILHGFKIRAPEKFEEYFGKYGLGYSDDDDNQFGYLTLNGLSLDTPEKKSQLNDPRWAFVFWRAGQDRDMHAEQLATADSQLLQQFYFRGDQVVAGYPLFDVVTSEYGVTILLDTYIERPNQVIPMLEIALKEAGLAGSEPAQWIDKEEMLLELLSNLVFEMLWVMRRSGLGLRLQFRP